LQDVYQGLEPHVKRGEIKQICVVQEVPKPERAHFWKHPEIGTQFPIVSCGATLAPKKVWGFVPVAEDGSAYFKVPAGVAARRCASCHASRHGRPGFPRKKWVRLTNPHLNDFLLAPLAKSEGGSEKCGRAVFTTTDDPDYQAILRTFEIAKKLLTNPPRADLDEQDG
jgi:hypothetical protein